MFVDYFFIGKKEPSWSSYILLGLLIMMTLPTQLLSITLAIKTSKKILINIANIKPEILKKLKEKDYLTTKNYKKWLNKYNLTYQELTK